MERLFNARAAAWLLASAAVGAWATAASAQDGEVTIRLAHLFTGSDARRDMYDVILDAWEADHPEVTLVREETAGDDHRLKLSTDLAAGNTPDVFYNWAPPNDVNKFVEAGVALDFNDFFAETDEVSPDEWTQSQLDYVTRGDAIVMLPEVGFKCFTLYNSAIFEEHGQTPPTTWDELLATSQVFEDAGLVPLNIGSKGGNPGHLLYNVVLSQLGGQPAAEALMTSYDASDPVFVEAANIVTQLREEGVIPEDSVGNGDWPGSTVLYNNGRAAMVFTCPWMLAQIPPEVAAVSEVMNFPAVPGATVDATSFHVGNINNGWMVNAQSFEDPAKRAAIVSLLETLLSDETRQATIEAGLFPAWDAGDVSGFEIDPLAAKVQAFTAQAPDTFPVVAALTPTAGSLTAYLEAMDRVFAGEDATTVFEDFGSALDRERP